MDGIISATNLHTIQKSIYLSIRESHRDPEGEETEQDQAIDASFLNRLHTVTEIEDSLPGRQHLRPVLKQLQLQGAGAGQVDSIHVLI